MNTDSRTRTGTIWPADPASEISGPPAAPGSSRATRWIAVVVAVCVVAGLVLFAFTLGRDQSSPTARALTSPAAQAPPLSPAATMIAKVLPSVVNIRVVQAGSTPSGTGEIKAEGSGVILTSNGLILTNNHVVQNALRVRAVFTSGRAALPGTVVGTDPQHDLAVIQVDATGLTPLPLGRSSDLQLADTVYAVGFPLDLGITVTSGIVSGLNRSVAVNDESAVEHLVGLVQTDAAINPGNSGGALVDGSGRLVAINTAGASATSADNVGFAIAIDGALPVVRRLLTESGKEMAWRGRVA
jgi:putative serine protease PepD